MSIEVKAMFCPNCGGELKIENSQPFHFCPFCGSQMAITNSNEKIFRKIDEAELEKQRVEQLRISNEIELEKIRLEDKRKSQKTMIIATIILSIIIVISFSTYDYRKPALLLIGILAFFGIVFSWIFYLITNRRRRIR